MIFLIQDTREKISHHNNIENYCKRIKLPILKKKLDVGDYRLANIDEKQNITFINNVSVDIKGGGLLELGNDLYRDMKAFNKKYKKCYEQGIELWVLIEEKINNLNELANWRNSHTKVNGRLLIDMIHRLKVSYGVRFKFASKHESPKILIEILNKKDEE